jgi:hypothetical protein
MRDDLGTVHGIARLATMRRNPAWAQATRTASFTGVSTTSTRDGKRHPVVTECRRVGVETFAVTQ